jgi:tRNA U54 and U55 pseudouridine synthase Pus10
MATEAQRRAVQNYKKKVKRITIDFAPSEMEMWEHIQAQDKKQTYIKSLIKADMEKGRA